jgi:nitrite reductase/ring-hydroxylating ferredoxin subunit
MRNSVELDQIPDRTVVELELDPETKVLIYREAEEVRVYRDICPHMGGPISASEVDPVRGEIFCPWHGYRFSLRTGELVKNPNTEIWRHFSGRLKSFDPDACPGFRLHRLSHRIESGRLVVEAR